MEEQLIQKQRREGLSSRTEEGSRHLPGTSAPKAWECHPAKMSPGLSMRYGGTVPLSNGSSCVADSVHGARAGPCGPAQSSTTHGATVRHINGHTPPSWLGEGVALSEASGSGGQACHAPRLTAPPGQTSGEHPAGRRHHRNQEHLDHGVAMEEPFGLAGHGATTSGNLEHKTQLRVLATEQVAAEVEPELADFQHKALWHLVILSFSVTFCLNLDRPERSDSRDLCRHLVLRAQPGQCRALTGTTTAVVDICFACPLPSSLSCEQLST